MVTLAQRIETLRTESGLSRPAASAALGFPKAAFEKFETGRQTPTRKQQEQLATYFGVSLFFLRGESNDRTRQESWMDAAGSGTEDAPAPARAPKPEKTPAPTGEQATLLDALLAGRQTQDKLRALVLETLRSPEGQALIAQVVAKQTSGKDGMN